MYTRTTQVAILLVIFLLACAPRTRADDMAKALALFDTEKKTAQSATSISANVMIDQSMGAGPSRSYGIVECMKPDFLRMELWPLPAGKTIVDTDESKPHDITISDGKSLYTSAPGNPKKIVERDLAPSGDKFYMVDDLPWTEFYGDAGQSMSDQMKQMMKDVHVTTKTWDGAPYTVIDAKLAIPGMTQTTVPTFQAYVGADNLIHRLNVKAGAFGMELDATNVRINPTLAQTDFNFVKPAYAAMTSSPIDPQALALLTKVDAATTATQALTATVRTVSYAIVSGKKSTEATQESTVELMRPKYALINTYTIDHPDSAKPTRDYNSTFASDGTTLWTIADAASKTYRKQPYNEFSMMMFGGQAPGPFMDFFNPHWSNVSQMGSVPGMSITIVDKGSQAWNGGTYNLVEERESIAYGSTKMEIAYDLYIGDDDRVHRLVTTSGEGGMTSVSDASVVALDTNPHLAEADFAYKPPAGMTLAKAQAGPVEKPLLANGKRAPNFTVHDRYGKRVRLSDYKGKVVVLDFWATWCGPCQASLPSTNAVARQFRRRHVIVLGVNVWDSNDAFKAWLPTHKNLDAIHFAIDPSPGGKDVASTLYNVSGIPAQYVIGRNGKIVWSADGFSGSDDDLIGAVNKALSARN